MFGLKNNGVIKVNYYTSIFQKLFLEIINGMLFLIGSIPLIIYALTGQENETLLWILVAFGFIFLLPGLIFFPIPNAKLILDVTGIIIKKNNLISIPIKVIALVTFEEFEDAFGKLIIMKIDLKNNCQFNLYFNRFHFKTPKSIINEQVLTYLLNNNIEFIWINSRSKVL